MEDIYHACPSWVVCSYDQLLATWWEVNNTNLNFYVFPLGTRFPLTHHCHSIGARETLDWPWGEVWETDKTI